MIDNEVSILRKVKHPNIILLVEEFDMSKYLYLVMEIVSVSISILSVMNIYIHTLCKMFMLLFNNTSNNFIRFLGIAYILLNSSPIKKYHEGKRKIIISFSGQFFQVLMRQGGFIIYFLLLEIRIRVFIFFLPIARCDVAFLITISLFSICLWMSICLYICQSN